MSLACPEDVGSVEDGWEACPAASVEVAVLGAGLTGTAAAKYLAQRGLSVALVGPAEGQHGAHGACYDEGRIYRVLDPVDTWAKLARRAIQRYASIQEDSGVAGLYRECGTLIFGRRDRFISETESVAARMKQPLELLQGASAIESRFPFLRVPLDQAGRATSVGLWQSTGAGVLSPRKLVQAQLELGRRAGVQWVQAATCCVERLDSGRLSVLAEGGLPCVVADRVLVAAGCYSSVLPLLPSPTVSVKLTGAQALLVELDEPARHRLERMPCLIYEGQGEADCWYLLPPVLYPDGRWLLKIGPSTKFAPPLSGAAGVEAWFAKGDCDEGFVSAALKALASLIPAVEGHIVGHYPKICVTDCTPNSHPYVDVLSEDWGVCSGMNGWGAKSSDALGWVAAEMMASGWNTDPEFPRDEFRALRGPEEAQAAQPGPRGASGAGCTTL